MLTATDLIGKMLQAKAREFEVPLVTYAEDMSLNNGMHLLMYGDHILANEVSMLGNIGGRTTPYYMKDFIQDWHVKAKFVHHGENKVRFNPLNETIRQEDVDWFMNLQSIRMNFVIDNLLERRKEKVGQNAEELRQYLIDGHHCYGPKALELGLIDKVTTPDQFFQEHFKGEAYTIGEQKLSLMAKLGLNKAFSSSNSMSVDQNDLFS